MPTEFVHRRQTDRSRRGVDSSLSFKPHQNGLFFFGGAGGHFLQKRCTLVIFGHWRASRRAAADLLAYALLI